MVPTCPYCGEELDYDEQVETYYEGESFSTKWRGGCPPCNRNFTWWENYTLTSIEDMTEGNE